jgi:ribosomal-protein-alanine N-acetyltransferase
VTPLQTGRLLLRQWRDSDRAAFAELNDDTEVMQYFPSRLSRAESDAFADRLAGAIETNGWGLWAVERRDTGEFIGFTGLQVPTYDFPFMPVVEVGWRLARPAWGRGFATEAAVASLDYGFEELDLDEIVAMTSEPNMRSRAVMDRLGMVHDPAEDFDHPAYELSDPLRRHLLYRLGRDTWRDADRAATDRTAGLPRSAT